MQPDSGFLKIEAGDSGSRIDSYLADRLGISRSKIQAMLTGGMVLLNGRPARKNRVLSEGDRVEWTFPEMDNTKIIPQSIELSITHADNHLVVIDKPAGLVMYPGPGHSSGTLLNSLIMRYPEMSDVGGKGRTGIFHRLDKDTSGLVAVARTQEAYQEMVRKMQSREVKRIYTALINGDIPADSGTIDAPVGRSRTDRKKMSVDRYAGKRAVSRFKVKERFHQGYTLVSVSLETGRTHQIRVHFSHIGFPVVGDKTYSGAKTGKILGIERQFLHASELSFEHPITGEEMKFESGLPPDLSSALESLRSANG